LNQEKIHDRCSSGYRKPARALSRDKLTWDGRRSMRVSSRNSTSLPNVNLLHHRTILTTKSWSARIQRTILRTRGWRETIPRMKTTRPQMKLNALTLRVSLQNEMLRHCCRRHWSCVRDPNARVTTRKNHYAPAHDHLKLRDRVFRHLHSPYPR